MNSPAAPSHPISVAGRFALMMEGLGRVVAARIGHYPITAPMIVYIWKRLNRINQRFQALATLIQAGKLPAERPVRPRGAKDGAPRRHGAARPCDPGAVWRLLPQRRSGWLCWVAPSRPGSFGAASYGEELRSLLGEPEMVALLAATPRMAKLLRPLCWALGAEASLARPRRAARSSAVVPEDPGAIVGNADVVAGRGGTRSGTGTATRKRTAHWVRPRQTGTVDPCLVAFFAPR